MRLRAGQQHRDLFRCRYVFVTRNPRFVQDARTYCLQSRLITEIQESPVIHQRELATIAWLRTGLGAAETVPRSHLLATCDRVLNLRREVRDAVDQKLRALTPDKIEQYELLLLDQKSLRRLADQTLNDETVITDENAEQLLEAMRRATVEDERLQYEDKLKASKAELNKKLKSERGLVAIARAAADKIAEERDAALEQLNELNNLRINAIKGIAEATTRLVRQIDRIVTVVVFLLAAISVSNYVFGWLVDYRIPSAILGGVLALFGAYHQIMNALERPKVGVPTIMGWVAQKIFFARIQRAGLASSISLERVRFDRGQIILDDATVGTVASNSASGRAYEGS